MLGTLLIHLARPAPYCHWQLCGSDQIHLYKVPMYRATAMAWCSLAHVSQNTWRTHCHVPPWSCTTPPSVATSPNNVLWRRFISHELVVSFDNHWASCSHKQWPSNVHQQCVNGKITHPRIHLKRFVKFRKLEHGWRKQLALKLSKALVTKLISLLG